jgi:hypothetical protein
VCEYGEEKISSSMSNDDDDDAKLTGDYACVSLSERILFSKKSFMYVHEK